MNFNLAHATLALLFFISGSLCTNAQLIYADYDWDEETTVSNVPEHMQAEDAYFVDRRLIKELGFLEGQIVESYIYHYTRKINTDDAVDKENKIYLTSNAQESVLVQKARVIKKDGAIIELTDEDIVVSEDEESGSTYRYFALEGLEKGADVEYLVKILRYPSTTGELIYFQGEEAQLAFKFELLYPEGLEFDYKAMNLPDGIAKLDTLENTARITFEFDQIDALKPEESATYDPHRQGVLYRMTANWYTGNRDHVNFKNAANYLYERYMAEPDKKALKAAEKAVKESKAASALNDIDKVHMLDRWLKLNIDVFDVSSEELEDPVLIMKNKFANEQGLQKLFALGLQAMEIPFELAITCSRYDMVFDPDYEVYNYLNELIFYFPKEDQFLDVLDLASAPGMISADITGVKALFVSELEAAGVKTSRSKVKTIPFLPMEASMDNMQVEATIDLDEDFVRLKYHKESTGYYAGNYQWIFPLVDEDARAGLREQMVEWVHEDIEIIQNEVQHIDLLDFGVKPLVHDFEVTCQDFLSVAGDKLLFKVGLVIGPQTEMYSEKERQLPVDGGYKHGYDRTIVLNIPQGYRIENLEDLKRDIRFGEGDEQIAFVSDYFFNEADETVTIHIEEYYNQVLFEVGEFENYRAVINAAADFNKLVLVLKRV